MKDVTLRGFLLLAIFATAQVLTSFASASIFYQPTASKGDLKILKGQKIKVVFVYDGMRVGDFSEKDYVNNKVIQYNAKKPGRGDQWLADWKGNRAKLFEPEFIKEFNYQGGKTHTSAQTGTDSAAYVLTVTTTFSEPGFNAGPIERAARINATCEFKDRSGNSVATLVMNNIASPTMMNQDFETSERFTECYIRLAKEVYKAIKKAK